MNTTVINRKRSCKAPGPTDNPGTSARRHITRYFSHVYNVRRSIVAKTLARQCNNSATNTGPMQRKYVVDTEDIFELWNPIVRLVRRKSLFSDVYCDVIYPRCVWRSGTAYKGVVAGYQGTSLGYNSNCTMGDCPETSALKTM